MADQSSSSSSKYKIIKLVLLVSAALFGVLGIVVLLGAFIERIRDWYVFSFIFQAGIIWRDNVENHWVYGVVHLVIAALCGFGFFHFNKKSE